MLITPAWRALRSTEFQLNFRDKRVLIFAIFAQICTKPLVFKKVLKSHDIIEWKSIFSHVTEPVVFVVWSAGVLSRNITNLL